MSENSQIVETFYSLINTIEATEALHPYVPGFLKISLAALIVLLSFLPVSILSYILSWSFGNILIQASSSLEKISHSVHKTSLSCWARSRKIAINLYDQYSLFINYENPQFRTDGIPAQAALDKIREDIPRFGDRIILNNNNNASLAEEKEFLKNYTVPFVQLEPKKTILVFSHIHNTFDKKKLLENGENRFQKKCDRTVDEFVKEEDLKKFYMETIDELLKTYSPGDPINKPDVLKQIKEIEEERRKMAEQQGKQNGKIILNQNGNHIELNNEQIVQIMQKQQEQLQHLSKVIMEKDRLIENLSNQLNNNSIQNNFIEIPNITTEPNKVNENNNSELKENIVKLIQLLDNKKDNLN